MLFTKDEGGGSPVPLTFSVDFESYKKLLLSSGKYHNGTETSLDDDDYLSNTGSSASDDAFAVMTRRDIKKYGKKYKILTTLPGVDSTSNLGYKVVSDLSKVPSSNCIGTCVKFSLRSGKRVFFLPNLKGVGNRLQLFSGLYVMSAYFHIPIAIPESAGWHQVWNIKQAFENQILYISDFDARTLGYYCSLHYIQVKRSIRHVSRVNFTRAVWRQNIDLIFPTHVTAVIGNSLTMRLIAMTRSFYSTLSDLGFVSHVTKRSINDKAYFLFGEFLNKIMVPSASLTEYMHLLYPKYDEEDYNSIHLRMGGRIADVPVFIVFMPPSAIGTIIQCVKQLGEPKKIYVASDSIIMKRMLSKNLTDYELIYSTNSTIPADTQMLKDDIVSYATFSAVAEMYILGHGKRCLMTPESTYSLAACALTGQRPIIIDHTRMSCSSTIRTALVNFCFCSITGMS